jgi:hypothetical protein
LHRSFSSSIRLHRNEACFWEAGLTDENPDPKAILPSFVAICIQRALVKGWIPNKPGPQFVLDLSKENDGIPLSGTAI